MRRTIHCTEGVGIDRQTLFIFLSCTQVVNIRSGSVSTPLLNPIASKTLALSKTSYDCCNLAINNLLVNWGSTRP
jgi:hypothetical protein